MSVRTAIDELRALLQGLGSEPTLLVCGASAFLVLAHHHGSVGAYHASFGARFASHPASGAFGHLAWFAASVLFYLVLPLLVSALTKGSFHHGYGLGLGDWRAGLSISALFLVVMLPVTMLAARWGPFQGVYPLAGSAAYTLTRAGRPEVSLGLFAIYEAGYLAYFVAWEFFFRGWLLHGLLASWGRMPALLAPILPFAVMHFGKAEPEALGSIIAGLALGILSLRTRSFWYGAALHGAVAVWMDWLGARSALLGS